MTQLVDIKVDTKFIYVEKKIEACVMLQSIQEN